MRIAVDATAISAAPSGARTRMIHLLRAYAMLPVRHEIVLFATRASGLEAALSASVDRWVHVDPAGGPTRRLLFGPDWHRRLDEVGADALCAETLPVPGDPGRPLLLTVHDLRGLEGPIGSPRRWYAKWMLPKALARVTQVIAVSHYTKGVLEQLGVPGDRISIVGNAPDPSLAAHIDPVRVVAGLANLGVTEPFVLALGHVEPRKNLGVLVDAIAQIAAHGPGPQLVFAGRDEVSEGARLAARATAMGVTLLRTGPVSDDVRAMLLRRAACVAVPSRLEGFGMVPLEAWTSGSPVVCSNAGALPEVAGDVCPKIDPEDAHGFSAAISRLISDPSAAREQVAAGRQRAATFTWEAAARALKEAHDRALPR